MALHGDTSKPRRWLSRIFTSSLAPSSISSSGNSSDDDIPSSATNNERTSYSDPDPVLISELIEYIEQNPSEKGAREILMHHYNTCGWFAGAREVAAEVLKLDPFNHEANTCLNETLRMNVGKGKAKANPRRPIRMDGKETKKDKSQDWNPTVSAILYPSSVLGELEVGYTVLRKNAEALQKQTKLLHELDGLNPTGHEGYITKLAMLAQGKVSSFARMKPLRSVKPPGSVESLGRVKDVARAMMTKRKSGGKSGFDVAFEDLEGTVKKLSRQAGERIVVADEYSALRDALVKRVVAVKALLPDYLEMIADRALMHAEHELLHRTYVNTETTYGDAVSDIPRENFWVSEDGYAWDMDELAQAITSNGGVMRNPLSKAMFTPADVNDIVQHPLGKQLAALQVDQSKLKRSVRPKTIDELAKLAVVLLEDMMADQVPSRHAIDAFAAYLATLPKNEQKAIDGLKVPAKDSHTGNGYDWTIGEAVRDAHGNRVCSHKTGDFLNQAATYLRK